MTRRLDPYQWPSTGFWCGVCGWPLHESVVAEGHATHPTCGPEAVRS